MEQKLQEMKELQETDPDQFDNLLYEYHRVKHPRMFKRWMKDLAKLEAGEGFRRVNGKDCPMSETEKRLLKVAKETGLI